MENPQDHLAGKHISIGKNCRAGEIMMEARWDTWCQYHAIMGFAMKR